MELPSEKSDDKGILQAMPKMLTGVGYSKYWRLIIAVFCYFKRPHLPESHC